jgi:hypothetical protein
VIVAIAGPVRFDLSDEEATALTKELHDIPRYGVGDPVREVARRR